jgi:hypothetical protein
VVNAAPAITNTSLPAATQGASYNQGLTVSGGTGAATCSLASGSLSGSGIGLSGCTLTGTAATPATYTFTVVATDANGVSSSASAALNLVVSNSTPVPNKLVQISGNGQSAVAGRMLANPFVVEVTDAAGNPISGATVTFAVTAGGGTLSATSAVTGANGTASTLLTLGATAGTNTVTAASGSLSGSPITFTATGTSNTTSGSGSVTWSQPSQTAGWPGNSAWITLPYDPVSGQTILYGTPAGASGDYPSDLFFYNSATNAFTHLGGTGGNGTCTADTATQPGERLPVGQMAVDTKRNMLWIYGGLNPNCAQSPRQDMYYLTLNANPMNDVWHQVKPAHLPLPAIEASMIYDPVDDVLFAYGYDSNASTSDQWIYCRTAENPTPGTPTAAQKAAGCSVGDDWNEINHGTAHPIASQMVGMIYDPVNHKVLMYGGMTSGGTQVNETWVYDVPSHTWTQKCQNSCVAPPVGADNVAIPALAYLPGAQKFWLHQSSGAGAPADWQYDPSADTWTKMTSSGTAVTDNMAMTYDVAQNKLIGWYQGAGARLWVGQMAAASTPVASNLASVSGNNQSGTVGTPLSNPLTVKVTDANGKPVSGVAVTFAVQSGGGSLSATKATSDASGLASTTLTLGTTVGLNVVTASSGTLAGSPVTFNLSGLAGPASALFAVSGSPQNGSAGQPLASPFTVKASDAYGNPVAGVAITFTVTSGGGKMSAPAVTTDANGLASSTLTLGPSAGTNTVTAAAGNLSGVTFTATAMATTGITWNQAAGTSAWPGGSGNLLSLWDPASQQTIIYGSVAGSASSNATDLFFYDSSANAFTHVSGTGSKSTACPADTASLPGDRVIYAQMSVDTKRNFLWIYGGACNGTVRKDMYYLTLNSNPTMDVWNKVSPAHFPAASTGASMVYDSVDDILFATGYDMGANTNTNWVYCRTAENPTPGTPTASQLAAGCTLPDDWNLVNVTSNGHVSVMYSGLVYDTVTRKIIQYGGSTPAGVTQNTTWAYDVPTKTWTKKALATAPPPVTGDAYPQPALAYNTVTKKLIYHMTSGAGAPADYQYDPTADTWTKLTSVGGGATSQQSLTYDSKNNVLIGFKEGAGTELWRGSLSGVATQ